MQLDFNTATIGLVALMGGATAFVFAPRFMALLLWPVLLWYPQNVLLGVLPWNAGLDDVYILLVAGRLLLHPRPHGLPPMAKGAVLIACGMLMMQVVSDFTGCIRYYHFLTPTIKDGLKGLIYVAFALAMALDIRTEQDVRRHLIAFGIAITGAFLLVLACFWSPYLQGWWEVTLEELLYQQGMTSRRAYGPFNQATDVGNVTCVVVPLAIGLLLFKPRHKKIAMVSGMVLLSGLAALLIAKTRSGILGLGVMFMTMTVLSKQRKYIVALEIVGVVAVASLLVGSELFGAAQDRLTSARMANDADQRFQIWADTVTNPSPWLVFFGEGSRVCQEKIGITPHNGYLDIVFLWGLGGVCMFSIMIVKAVKWSLATLRHDSCSWCRGAAWGFIWGLVAIAVLSIPGDPWFSAYYRMMVYFLLVIVCARNNALSHQVSAAPAGAAIGSVPPRVPRLAFRPV